MISDRQVAMGEASNREYGSLKRVIPMICSFNILEPACQDAGSQQQLA